MNDFSTYILKQRYKIENEVQTVCELLYSMLEDIRNCTTNTYYNALDMKYHLDQKYEINKEPYFFLKYLFDTILHEAQSLNFDSHTYLYFFLSSNYS